MAPLTMSSSILPFSATALPLSLLSQSLRRNQNHRTLLEAMAPASPVMTLQVESSQVIRLILQYLRANGLQRTAHVLNEESGVNEVGLETETLQRLRAAIIGHQWEQAITILEPVIGALRPSALYDLYELMLVDLINNKDHHAARIILQESSVMRHLQQTDAARWTHLLELEGEETKGAVINNLPSPSEVADRLMQQIPCLPTERLLALLGQALRQEVIDDKVPPEGHLDVFYGLVACRGAGDGGEGEGAESTTPLSTDQPITRCFRTRNFTVGSHPEVAAFSPSGRQLVLGLADGFLEMVNLVTGERRRDLPYQREMLEDSPDNLGSCSSAIATGHSQTSPSPCAPMVMEQPILSLDWSPDEAMLATGALDGSIGIWAPGRGSRLALLSAAHDSGVGCLRWAADGNSVFSRAYDENGLVKQWNWRSGRLIRQFSTQTSSYVTDMRITSGGTMLWLGTAEGQLLRYDIKTGTLLARTAPLAGGQLAPEAVIEIIPLSRDGEMVLVCGAQGRLRLVNGTTDKLSTFKVDIGEASVRSAHLSPRGRHLYLLLDSGTIIRQALNADRSFSPAVATLVGRGPELLGGTIHPHVNHLVTLDSEGTMKYWKP